MDTQPLNELVMGQNPVPPVNTNPTTKIRSKISGEFTYPPNWYPETHRTPPPKPTETRRERDETGNGDAKPTSSRYSPSGSSWKATPELCHILGSASSRARAEDFGRGVLGSEKGGSYITRVVFCLKKNKDRS